VDAGNVGVLDPDLPLALDLLHDHVGDHVVDLIVGEHAPGLGVQRLDEPDRLVDQLDGLVEPLGDLGEAVGDHVLEVVAHDQDLEVVFVVDVARLELDQEALAQVAGGHAGGLEGLEHLQRVLGLLQGAGRLDRDAAHELLVELVAQVAVVVDVPDQVLGDLLVALLEVQLVQLGLEHLREGLGAVGRVLHGLQLLVLLAAAGPGPVGARELLPLLVEALQPLELGVEGLLGGHQVHAVALGGLGALLPAHLPERVLALDLDGRVHLHFALDQPLQVEGRELEDLDGLQDLRGEPQLLLQALGEAGLHAHGGFVLLVALAPFERFGQDSFAGELKRATRRQSAGQPGDLNSVGLEGGPQMERSGVAVEVWVGGQDHLADLALADPAHEGLEGQVPGAHPLEQADRAEQHVVEAPVAAALLHGEHVLRALDHAEHRLVAAGVGADGAGVGLAHVEAGLAGLDVLLHGADRVGQPEGGALVGLDQVEGEPLGGPLADAWKALQLGDEPIDRLSKHASLPSLLAAYRRHRAGDSAVGTGRSALCRAASGADGSW
jgi:hypothetical protein